MAKKINLADLVFKVSDDGSLKVMAGSAKKAGKSLKDVEQQTDKTTYATKKGINQTANQTKNFANLARGISGSLVPAYATLAANVFALTAVFGFLKQAADYRLLKEGQSAFASVTGVGYKTLTNTIIEATDAQIKYSDAAQAAAIGTAAGLSAEQLGKIGAAAKTVSIALGRDVTDSFNRLVRGITKAEPELLDELGIVLRLETATKKYAAQLGVSKDELSAFQRTQAVSNEVLGQVEDKFEAINAIISPQTNAINKLNKSFDDLLNTFRLLIAGPAESLANFFSNNIYAAAGALTLFALPILQGILPAFDDWAKKAEESLGRHNKALQTAKNQIDEYKIAQAQARAEAAKSQSQQLKNLQRLAGQSEAGKAGTGMAALQRGDAATPSQIRALRGQLTKGIGPFKGMTAAMKKEWEVTLNAMTNSTKVKFADRAMAQFKRLELGVKATTARIKVYWQSTMSFMQKASRVTAGVVSKAFGFLSFLSIGVLLFEGLKSAANKLGIFGTQADITENALQRLLHTQRELNKELEEMMKADEKLAKEKIALPLNQLVKRQGERLTTAALGPSFEAYRENLKLIADLEKKGVKDPVKTVTQQDSGNSITGGITQLSKAINNRTADEIALANAIEARDSAEKALVERITLLSDAYPELNTLIKDGKLVTTDLTKEQYRLVDAYVTGANAVKYLEQSTASYQQSLQGFLTPMTATRKQLNLTTDRRKALAAKAASPAFKQGTAEEQLKGLEELSGVANTEYLLRQLDSQERSFKVAQDRAKLDSESLKNKIYGNTILGQHLQTNLQIATKQAEIDALTAEIAFRKATLDESTDKDSAQRAIQDLESQVLLLGQQKKGLENSINLTRELGVAATEAFANSMQKGIQGVIEGTMSIKDAFKSMAASILQSLAQVLAKMLTMRILSSAFGIPMADGGIIPMAKGGIIKGYKHGGIATEPTYLVGEAGPEAVVPLPDGRSIPVNMNGSGGTNNVTINVDANGGTSSTMDGERGKALGMAIQAAVMETIQREKRPGGVLSRN